MKTPTPLRKSALRTKITAITAALAGVILSLSTVPVRADIPDRQSAQLNGMFQVVSSSDPLFPISPGTEWFMDFGKGIHNNTFSGSVAVSRRQNPDVKVRIMAWQYFPAQSSIVIGNQFDRSSSGAVAKGSWNVGTTDQGIVFRRGQYQMVVQRADPRDY